MAALEFGGTIPVGYTQIEWLTTLPPPDSTSPLSPSRFQFEFAATPHCDAGSALEWQGVTGGSLLTNSAADLEWLARQTRDPALSGEALARAVGDALVLLENVSAGARTADADSPVMLEACAPVRTDAGLPTGWAVAASLIAEMPLPVELAAAKPATRPVIPQVSGRRLRLFRV